jgi:hypothetical protein
MLRRVALVRSYVSEECGSSISSETSVLTRATRRDIPEDGTICRKVVYLRRLLSCRNVVAHGRFVAPSGWLVLIKISADSRAKSAAIPSAQDTWKQQSRTILLVPCCSHKLVEVITTPDIYENTVLKQEAISFEEAIAYFTFI